MTIRNMPVYVIKHPKGHTTVRTRKAVVTPAWPHSGEGYNVTEGTITWKVVRRISERYAATLAADEGDAADAAGEEL